MLRSDTDREQAHLMYIVVGPSWRDRGFGSRLVADACTAAAFEGYAMIDLVTREENENARRFYLARGWEESGTATTRDGDPVISHHRKLAATGQATVPCLSSCTISWL
jgi:ribosomal protein S18 acetylase RimI-like enzyme